ncbi:MAG: porin family protein [Acidobacteria bacterium]|nr:porin family protein [Acidobacteriota bacterium]
MKHSLRNLCVATALILTSAASAYAQTAPTTPWSVDVGIGWENSLTGNAISSGVGRLANRAVVIEEQTWDDVYGTAVLFRIGVGYELGDRTEARANFRYHSKDTEALQIGNLGGSPLFAELDSYKAWALEGGYRSYFAEGSETWRPYAEGTVGFARISEIQASLAAPALAIVLSDADFFDSSTAFTFAVAGGVLYNFTDRFAADVRLGFRYIGGLNEADGLQAGGLENIDDDTSRWTLPLTVGARVRF